MRQLMSAVVLGLFTTVAVAAEKESPRTPPTPRTFMAQPGKLIFSDDFAGGQLKPGYRVAKGTWTIADGVLKATELKEDKHAASMRHDLAFTNAVFQYDFKLGGGKATHLSINHARGHLCRVTITPDGFTMRRDKPDKKGKEPAVTLDKVEQNFKPGRWYTMTVEIVGDEMVAHVDDQHIGYGRHAGIAAAKSNFGLPSSGEATWFDNLRVWDATMKSDWPAKRETIKAKAATASR